MARRYWAVRRCDVTSARIAIPATANAGEVIEIKTLVTHPMESGFRRDDMGEVIPRNILTQFQCSLDNQTVFKMDFKPGIAANPYVSFFVRVEASGTFEFVWSGQNGFMHRETRQIRVTP